MSAATVTPGARIDAAQARNRHRVTFGRLLVAEWIKIRSLRSTWWTAGSTVVVMVLISLVADTSVNATANNPEFGGGPAGAEILVTGFIFAQLSVAVLGALVITGEYSTGMIRSTLAAAPSRLPALWAKSVITAVLTAAIAVVALGASYLLALLVITDRSLAPDLGEAGVLRSLAACVGYLVLVALLSVGVGTALRHSAGAIFALVAILFVVFIVAQFFSQQWIQDLSRFLPLNAGLAMMNDGDVPDGMFSQLQGTLVMIGWAVLALGTGAVLLRRRDA